jgi:hypothetical protein
MEHVLVPNGALLSMGWRSLKPDVTCSKVVFSRAMACFCGKGTHKREESMNTLSFAAVKPALLVIGELLVFLMGRKIMKKVKGVAQDAIGDAVGDVAGEWMDDE